MAAKQAGTPPFAFSGDKSPGAEGCMETNLTHAIDSEHPEYRAKRGIWKRYRDLYVGGEQLRASASEYLIRRQKEAPEVYHERLERVFYENYAGSIVDWYASTLFRREPVLLAEGDDLRARKFLGQFSEDCDLRGTTLTDFYRKQFLDAMVCGVSYSLVDFPRAERIPATLAEEDREGTSRAYLSHCPAEQLINWATDERGDFEWAVIRTKFDRQPTLEAGERREQTRWLYYDRRRYQIYRSVEQPGQSAVPQLESEGEHAFASQNRVPLFPLRMPEGLWLMNKAGLLQLEHFNKSNALGWALTLGLFATPVIYSERDWNQVIGESYYIQLGVNDRFGWTEPEGKVFQLAADNLTRLQEEIYRVCYLLTQSGNGSTNRQQSGVSKQRDYAITQEVLRGFGDVVKDAMKRVLRAMITARKDDISIDVSGLDEFDIGDFSGELEDARTLLGLGIESPTLKKQVFKKLAFKYLSDVRQEVKDRIAGEIEQDREVKQ